MNKRQAKKQAKKFVQNYLTTNFDETELWCITHKCLYFDFMGIYGGGCVFQFAPKGFRCKNPYFWKSCPNKGENI